MRNRACGASYVGNRLQVQCMPVTLSVGSLAVMTACPCIEHTSTLLPACSCTVLDTATCPCIERSCTQRLQVQLHSATLSVGSLAVMTACPCIERSRTQRLQVQRMPVTLSVGSLAVMTACPCIERSRTQRLQVQLHSATLSVGSLAVMTACPCIERSCTQRLQVQLHSATCTVGSLEGMTACPCIEHTSILLPACSYTLLYPACPCCERSCTEDVTGMPDCQTLPACSCTWLQFGTHAADWDRCDPATIPCTPAPAPAPACAHTHMRARRSTVERINGQRPKKSTACAHVLDGQRPGQSTVNGQRSTVNGFYFLRSTVTPGKVDAINGQRLIAINGQRNLTDTMKCSTILFVRQSVTLQEVDAHGHD
jgi:hypothetical protein